jgi:hypothetical protein
VFDRVQNPKTGQALTEEEAALAQVLKGMSKGDLIGLLIHEKGGPTPEELRHLMHALTERLWGRERGDKKKAPAKEDPKSEQAARAESGGRRGSVESTAGVLCLLTNLKVEA